MTDRQKAIISIILFSLLGGGMGAIAKVGLLSIPPLSFAFLRFLIAFLIVIPFMLRAEGKIIKDFISLAPLSLLATINVAFFTIGIKTTTATISGILYAAVPFTTAFFSYLFFSERLSSKRILGIVIGFLGVLIVVLIPIIEKNKAFSGDLLGNLLICIAVVSWSFYMVFSKKKHDHHSPFVIISIFIILTTIILFPFFLLELKTNYGWWNNIKMESLVSVFYAAIIGTVVSYILNQYAIKHGGSVFASMAFYIQPLVAFLSAFILLGEGLTSGIVIGGILALLGVFFATKK